MRRHAPITGLLSALLATACVAPQPESLPRVQASSPPVVESPLNTDPSRGIEPVMPVNTPPFSAQAAGIEVFDELPTPDSGLIRGIEVSRYAESFLTSYVISYCIQANPQPFTMRDVVDYKTQYELLRNSLKPAELNAINRETRTLVFNSSEFDGCARDAVREQLESSTAELALLNENLRSQPDYNAEPVLTNFVAPVYPRDAMTRGLEGTVTVAGTIGTDGLVYDARVVKAEPPGVFDEAALKAFSRERYTPRYENGRKVPTENHEKIIYFRLK